jgi:hypothetical protein
MLKHKKTFNGYKPGGPGFDQKITGLTQNGMKLIFLSWSTWFDPY